MVQDEVDVGREAHVAMRHHSQSTDHEVANPGLVEGKDDRLNTRARHVPTLPHDD